MWQTIAEFLARLSLLALAVFAGLMIAWFLFDWVMATRLVDKPQKPPADPVPEPVESAEIADESEAEEAPIEFEPIALPWVNLWPSTETLTEMLRDGSNVQVGELLGVARESVRLKRQQLNIEPLSKGGSLADRQKRRQEFQDKWGWWKRSSAS